MSRRFYAWIFTFQNDPAISESLLIM